MAPPVDAVAVDYEGHVTSCRANPPAKKRKATYVVRKEEATALRRQLETLQHQVTALKALAEHVAMGPSEHLRQLLGVNHVLNEALHSQQLVVAGAQSTMAEFQEKQPSNPLFSDIHLPQAWDQRRQLLLRLKDDMFARGCRYVLERSRHLDLLKKHSSEQRFEDGQGAFCCERFELCHFVGVQSVKQVYDAATFFLTNAEISMSEATGLVIVREDYDSVDNENPVCNSRLICEYPDGLIVESSRISFSQYVEHSDLFGGGPCAMFVADSAVSDALYPYSSNDRVRNDVSAMFVITEMRRKKQKDMEILTNLRDRQGVRTTAEEDEEEVVVVMRRAVFMKIHQPEFEISMPALHALGDDAARWGKVMVQTVRDVMEAA
ncbi:hypothetical protein BBJ28_00001757 [Nothophytophthora sp. Chile5]|nr:hypothetical protein BBJ28_00001757 [Nothophytophthora sp. Chile5]